MRIEHVPLTALHPAERNTRVHSSAQIDELVRSYKMFGQIRPIVVDEDNVIWCGNGFYEAATKAGASEVAVYRVSGLTLDQKRKLMLADNQIYTLGGTNNEVMDQFLSEMQDFDVPGYDADMLAQLYGSIEEATQELQSYGRIDAEMSQSFEDVATHRENMQEVRTYLAGETAPAPAAHSMADETLPPTIQHAQGMVNIPKDKNTRPFIVCPKCGEKILV